MPITVFSDVRLPNSVIEAGVRGKNMRLNSRVPTDSGFEAINVVWSQTLRQFEIGIAPMRVAQWQAIEALHEITDGGAFGFLMEDPKDRTATNGIVAAVTGGYQLYKRYIEAGSQRTKDRKITRPVQAGMTVYLDGDALDPAQWAINVENGVLTVTDSPAANRITWAGRFLVPVHFLDDSIDWQLVTGGAADARFLAGPSVVLQEVRE